MQNEGSKDTRDKVNDKTWFTKIPEEGSHWALLPFTYASAKTDIKNITPDLIPAIITEILLSEKKSK